jgi:MFS family permease
MSLFAFANATDAFILLKAIELGASYLLAPLLWFFLHVLKAGTATWGGRLADLHGRRQALVWGWSVYAVTWTSVGFAQSLGSLCLLTTLYGTAHGLTEGAERALVSELSDGRGKGRAFGAYHLLMGFSAMAASLAFGLMWDSFGSTTAFVVSGSCALVSALWLHGLRSS